MKKIYGKLDEYYFNFSMNKWICATYGTLVIFNIILYVMLSKNGLNITKGIIVKYGATAISITIAFVSLLFGSNLFGKFYTHFKNFIKNNYKNEGQELKYQRIKIENISRERQIKNILKLIKEKNNNIICVTGQSGAGKSTILKEMCISKKVYYCNNNYFRCWTSDLRKDKKYKVIILDQFERALFNEKELNKFIKNIPKIKSKIVICFRHESYFQIYNYFNNKLNKMGIKIVTYNLTYNKEDLEHINEKLISVLGINEKNASDQLIYTDLTKLIKSNIIPFITLDLIIQMAVNGPRKLEQMYINFDKSFAKIAEEYICSLIESLSNAETAYMILFLMCKDKKFEYINSIDDFKNITFEAEDVINEIIGNLKEFNLVKNVIDGDGTDRSHLCQQFELSHDYFLGIMDNICRNKLSAEVSTNIEYYNLNSQDKRDKTKNATHIDQAMLHYKTFYDKKSQGYANFVLTIFLLFSIVGNLLNWIAPYCSLLQSSSSFFTDNKIALVCLNINVLLSVYYIYNYYYWFLRILRSFYILLIIIGSFLVLSVFLFPKFWAISLGAEVVLAGLVMYNLFKKVRQSEKKFFNKRVLTFLMIGIITMVLGFIFVFDMAFYPTNYLLYGLYFVYILVAVLIHINKQYILGILGKIVYD